MAELQRSCEEASEALWPDRCGSFIVDRKDPSVGGGVMLMRELRGTAIVRYRLLLPAESSALSVNVPRTLSLVNNMKHTVCYNAGRIACSL